MNATEQRVKLNQARQLERLRKIQQLLADGKESPGIKGAVQLIDWQLANERLMAEQWGLTDGDRQFQCGRAAALADLLQLFGDQLEGASMKAQG